MGSSYLRSDRRLSNAQLVRWAAVFLVSLFVHAASATVEASIVGPGAPKFSLEPLDGKTISGHACESRRPPSEDSSCEQSRQIELGFFLSDEGSGSNTSSTSGSPSMGGPSASTAILTFPARVNSDSTFAGWVRGEYRAAHRSSEGNELLRPPQVYA